MKRVMVNLSDETGRLIESKAAAEKRSASAHISLLVENDLRQSGHLASDDAPAEILAASAIVGFPVALKLIKRAARKRAQAAMFPKEAA